MDNICHIVLPVTAIHPAGGPVLLGLLAGTTPALVPRIHGMYIFVAQEATLNFPRVCALLMTK